MLQSTRDALSFEDDPSKSSTFTATLAYGYKNRSKSL
jgi:hypothetical protein